MRLLVGLGNPGSKYERTRHNIGFRVAQRAAEKLGATLGETRWNGVLGTAGQVAVILPQTFMNLSGECVGHAARFWKVPVGEIVVVHDDMDLEFGRLQVKVGGGDGGHNGLKSLKEHVGAEFTRVRFGVGRPPQMWDPADWVLSKFYGDEEDQLVELVDTAAEAATTALSKGAALAMNRFNRKPK